jgi:hypothetical protein
MHYCVYHLHYCTIAYDIAHTIIRTIEYSIEYRVSHAFRMESIIGVGTMLEALGGPTDGMTNTVMISHCRGK